MVCKDFLPFNNINYIKRNVDNLPFIPDFANRLNPSCFWKNDTHMNVKGGKILSFSFLNYIDNSFNSLLFNKLINESDIDEKVDPCDLLSFINWSYSLKDKEKIAISSCQLPIPKRIKNLNIPKKFEKSRIRESEYILNEDSFSDLRVLIFRDSTTSILKYFLSMYFREIFFYWDHLRLNEELIKWYKPDVIIEIRAERFLEFYISPEWVKLLKISE